MTKDILLGIGEAVRYWWQWPLVIMYWISLLVLAFSIIRWVSLWLWSRK